MARIAVVGPGAMGSLFAARLALAGHDVGLICRQPGLAAQLARDGIVVEREGAESRAAVWAIVAGEAAPPVDYGLVLVKSFDTESAARAIAPLLGERGVAASLQNGLGNVEQLAAVVGRERVIAGVTSQGATLLAPGRVRHAGFGPTFVTELVGGDGPRARALATLLTEAGLPSETRAALEPLVWAKLVANAAINPLTALTGLRNGELLDSEHTASLLDDLARETAAVAAALGVQLPFGDPVAHARHTAEITRMNRSSMLQDVERRRRTEVDAINGAVVELGARLGVPTPANLTVYRLIKGVESGYRPGSS